MNNTKQTGLIMSRLPEIEYKMYDEQLKQRKGAKEKACTLSGLSRYTYYNIMKGGLAKKKNIQKVIAANVRTIKQYINTES